VNKKEIGEIKKLYTKDNSIRTLAGCYVNAEGEIISTFKKTFLNIEETEIFKYLELFKKGLSGNIGKNLQTFELEDAKSKQSLIALRDSELKNEEMLTSFYKSIIEQYPNCENYAILLINNTYDVVARTDDGFKNIDGSDGVYNYIHVFICPVKLEKPGLIFSKDNNSFVQKETRWELQMPTCSILYPSFEERQEDSNYITCYTKDTAGTYNQMLSSVFSINFHLSPDEQMEEFHSIMESVLEKSEEKIEVITKIQEVVKEKIAETEGTKNVVLSCEEIGNMLQNNGIPEESIRDFKENYANVFGTENIPAENLFSSKNIEVKTPDIIIKAKADKKIQSKIIDGKKCLVIAIEQNENIEVNGINL